MSDTTPDFAGSADSSDLPGQQPGRTGTERTFTRRVLKTLALAALFVLAGLMLIYGIRVFLLAFAGILLGVGLAGLADGLARWSGMRRGWALTLVLIVLVGGLVGSLWGFGSQLAGQADKLSQRLPQSAAQIRQELARMPLLKRQLGGEAQAQQAVEKASRQVESQARAGAARNARQALTQTASALGGVVLIFFLGLFFATSPGVYRAGVLQLVPHRGRRRAGEVMDVLGQALRRWWVGTLFAMATAGVMTFLGLWLIGVPLALSLAVLAALGEIVPHFGPIAAAVPAVMLGFLESPGKALAVAGLYIVIQTLQSYIVTPLVQQRAVDQPPALQIVAQVLMATLFGPLGLLLATPLVVVAMVLVRMLYVQDVLKEPVPAGPGMD